MFFSIARTGIPTDVANRAYLLPDNWDDWFRFRTMFTLMFVGDDPRPTRIGSVKIGHVGLQPGSTSSPGVRAPELPETFDELQANYFSLGMGEDYYENLNSIPLEYRTRILVGLRDFAYDNSIFNAVENEPSVQDSLLRSVSAQAVRGRLNRLAHGNAELTPYSFQYQGPHVADGIAPLTLSFHVVPDSRPPTNVHVLIGRNGVGKTRTMRHLVEAILGREQINGQQIGHVTINANEERPWGFAGLVVISFSAFDNGTLQPAADDRLPFTQVGLRHRVVVEGIESGGIKDPAQLATDFRESLGKCKAGLRAERWRAAVEQLETDDLFAEANILDLIGLPEDGWAEAVEHKFSLLSSGHAVVLLTMTKLVELVDENTLVFLDEPEGHLHPPLLAAFIRSLSDLLVKRNGVAIVATHSPVVLQEAPSSCAWKLRRSGAVAVAERPTIETFGENVGILTREVFGLEVTRSGFHSMLAGAVNIGHDYEGVLGYFGGQLGLEARAIVQALISEREAE